MKYAELDDKSLVMLTLSGEVTAYETLVIKYQKAVLASACSVTHNTYMAEDAAQDAFVTAWMKLNILKEPSKYRSWVCRIAENCAKRMMERYRVCADIEEFSDFLPDTRTESDPAYAYEKKEETSELYGSIEKLPDRVRMIIRMFYIEEKSVGEIAEKLGITIGTVKSQLYDGRMKLRKDLGAMDEKKNDTLTERVMKKVEELKKWQYKKEKNGFETVYRDVLNDVEALPESEMKQNAMADVLLRGWWWIPGEQNDALFARIKEAALAGKNEDVMSFVISRESEKMWGDAKITWLRDTAIPELSENGFSAAVGKAWLQIAQCYIDDFRSRKDELQSAAAKALETLPVNTVEAALAGKITEVLSLTENYKDLPDNRFIVKPCAVAVHMEDGEPMLWESRQLFFGSLEAYDWGADRLFANAAEFDGHFTMPGLKVGENYLEKLYFTDDNASVETPAGKFEGCEVWTVRNNFEQRVTYYKDGVGIVRLDFIRDGYATVYMLSSYTVNGTGLLPLETGNEWRYNVKNDGSLLSELVYRVDSAADGRILLCGISETSRTEYNENSWEDMVQAISNEYYEFADGKSIYRDVSHYIERAEKLASTPMQKAHIKAAGDVARRIMATSTDLNPGTDLQNRWNFFARELICRNDSRIIKSDYNSRWSFELKSWEGCYQNKVLLNNFIYDILSDNGQALWNDAWTDGYTEVLRKPSYDGSLIKSEISCSACGDISVPAGTFGDCLKVSVNTSGYPEGYSYRNGMQEFTFAPGIGLISAVSDIEGISAKSVYLLTKYEGTGKGFMPMGDGFFRRFEAQGLTDGYIGWTEYTTVKADVNAPDGGDSYVLFSNQCGVRENVKNITLYSSVMGEDEERRLYSDNKTSEAQQKGKINELKILFHLFFRDRNIEDGDSSVCSAYLTLIIDAVKALGGGSAPDALTGFYARTTLVAGAACMSCDQFEKGFEYLDESFAAYRKWQTFPDDALLSVGKESLYNDVRMVKGKPILVLPDGTREQIPEADEFSLSGGYQGKDLPYHGMTHLNNWAWFRPAAEHPVYGEKFKEYLEKAKKLAEE